MQLLKYNFRPTNYKLYKEMKNVALVLLILLLKTQPSTKEISCKLHPKLIGFGDLNP